jgi:hypothetical protein
LNCRTKYEARLLLLKRLLLPRAVESGLNTALNKITAKIVRFINVSLLVIAGIYLVYHYGLTVLGFLAAAVYMIGHGVGIW